jgi:hypothetical protein
MGKIIITASENLYKKIMEIAEVEAKGQKRKINVSKTVCILLHEAIKNRILCGEAMKTTMEYLKGDRP